jgi:hypothetical protein
MPYNLWHSVDFNRLFSQQEVKITLLRIQNYFTGAGGERKSFLSYKTILFPGE